MAYSSVTKGGMKLPATSRECNCTGQKSPFLVCGKTPRSLDYAMRFVSELHGFARDDSRETSSPSTAQIDISFSSAFSSIQKEDGGTWLPK